MDGDGGTMSRLLRERRLAVGADPLLVFDDKTALATRARLDIAQRGATGKATRLAGRVSRVAVSARNTAEALGQLSGGAMCLGSPFNDLPYLVGEPEVFEILGDIVKPGKQVEGVLENRNCAYAQAGGDPDPILFA